ncbi:MAG: lipopolysaccharide biosynthesis protein [Steroidobacterales bacterium]
MLQALLRSPSLRTAAAMGVGGVCFSVGGLILARELPTQEYALVSLVLGIIAVAGNTAPMGLDQVVLRRGIPLDARWRHACLGASLVTALAAGGLSGLIYHLSTALMASVAVMTFTMGIAQSVGAHFQGQRHFGIAVWVLQLLNGTIALIALVTAALGLVSATAVCGLMSVTAVIGAAAVWWRVIRVGNADSRQLSPWKARGEAASLATTQAGGSTFIQAERLLVGPTVGLHDLATYGVLAAFVSSPFRLLQAAVQFTLIPRLREARDAKARRALIRREAALIAVPLAAGSAALWLVAPPLAHWLLAGRYELGDALIAVTLAAGWLKLLNGFLTAVVVSCGEERRLGLLSAICWGTLGVSVAGAFLAIPWGLVGVLGGIAVGWLVRCLLAGWLALACLQEPRDGDVRRLPQRSPLSAA